MRVFTFLTTKKRSKTKRSESDKNVPSYEEVLTEVEKRLAKKKNKKREE